MSKRIPPRLEDEAPTDAAPVRWKLGALLLDEARRELCRDGQAIALEPKPLNLLMLLVRHPGELITKDELIERLWGGRPVTDTVIARCVAKLRIALDAQQDCIRTVHGYGYRYIGPVTAVDEAAAPPAPAASRFNAGDEVPGRAGWVLLQHCGSRGETWVAERKGNASRRVFKFAQDSSSLSQIKREVTVCRVLNSAPETRDGVVELLDWQFEEPPAFIELGWCEGGNLREWLDQHGGAAQLSLDERLMLIAQVAETLSAVHALGILHKDLKPENILVESSDRVAPRLRIGDFGSGRVVDWQAAQAMAITRMGQTQLADDAATGSSGGTPLYLAPEVVSGRTATRMADIYALGVMLYQLLVADFRRPLAPGWEREIEDALLREDIAAACEQNPDLRLPDARLLAERLRSLPARRALRTQEQASAARHLQDQLALQRSTQRRRLLRRIAVALALGLVLTLALAGYALRQQKKAEAATATAEAVNRFVNQDLLGSADPFNKDGGQHVTLLSVLDAAQRRLPALEQEQPLAAAQMRATLGQTYYDLAQFDAASHTLEEGLAHARKALGEAAPETDRLRLRLAEVSWKRDRFDEAENLYQTVAARPEQDDPEARQRRYTARAGLVWMQYMRGQYAACIPSIDAVLRETGPGIDAYDTASSHWTHAECSIELNHYAEATRDLDRVSAIYKTVLPEGNILFDWVDLTRIYLALMTDHPEQAEAMARRILDTADGSVADSHWIRLDAEYHLALALMGMGRSTEALPLLESLYAVRLRLDGENQHVTRFTMNALSRARLATGNASAALELATRAHDLSIQQIGKNHPYTLDLARTKAEALLAVGQKTEALQLAGRTHETALKVLPANNPTTALFAFTLARAQAATGDAAGAHQSAQWALTMLTTIWGAQSASASKLADIVKKDDYSRPFDF